MKSIILITGNDAQTKKEEEKESGSALEDQEVAVLVVMLELMFLNSLIGVLDKNMQIANYVKRHELEIENSSDKFYVRQVRVDDRWIGVYPRSECDLGRV